MSGHDRYLELAAAAIDFELAPDEATDLSTHLARCVTCRATSTELQADARVLRRLTEGAPAERVRATVHAAAARGRSRGDPAPLTALIAALVVVLAVVGGLSAGAYLRVVRGPADPAALIPDWTRLTAEPSFPAGAGNSAVLGLAATPGVAGVDLIAVGTGSTGGRVWISADGDRWSPVPDTPTLDRARLEAVTAAGDRILAVGSRVDTLGGPIASTWLSADGRTWTRTDLPGATGLLAVAASPSRMVVAGSPQAGTGPGDLGAPVWSSSDGSHWVRVDALPFIRSTVTGLTVGGPGFVAVGYDDRGGVVWTSLDGILWTRAGDPSTFDDARVMSVAPSPGGLVAVGFDADGPVAWLSVDGASWVRVSGIGPVGARMSAVTSTPFGLIAVGGGAGDSMAWRSADGRSWGSVGGPAWAGQATVAAVVARGELVIAGGRVGTHGAVWIGRSESAATP